MAIVQADRELPPIAGKEFPEPRPDISFHAFGNCAALFDPVLRRVFILRPAEAVAWCLFSEAGGQVTIAAEALAAASGRRPAEARPWLEVALAQWAAADLLGSAPPPAHVAMPESPQLEAAAIPAPAALRRYQMLDLVVEVAFPRNDVALTADTVLGVARTSGPALAKTAVVRDGRGWAVIVDGYVAERASRPSQVIPALKLALARLALSRANGVAAVHASAVACCGRAVLLPAPAGAGKSTLAAGCAFAGWELVADDTVVLDGPPDNPVLRPLPLASCLKPGSWPPLIALGADLESLAIHERLDGRRARYLAAPLPAKGPRPLAAIVVVRWKASGGSPARLVPLSPLQGFEALMPQVYPLDRPFDAALVGYAAALVARTPCFALEYSKLPEGIALLARARTE